ncbi:MAG: hypothetical protein KKA90_00775, partial [Nanoarchaeota archaeon]|nr:hypothetical protein [Nanoarchaeota archaeon]
TIEVCTNSEDDDCDGEVNEGCAIAATNCQNGIQDEGEEGVDCGGVCEQSCEAAQMIWMLFIIAGVGIMGIVGMLIRYERNLPWDRIKRRYRYGSSILERMSTYDSRRLI